MSVGNINVGSDHFANIASTVIKSFMGSLGLNSRLTTPEQARTFGRKLAEPINWLFGANLNGKALIEDLRNQHSIENAASPDLKFFADHQVPEGIFLKGAKKPLLDHRYSQLLQDILPIIYANDKQALFKLAKNLTQQLERRGVFDSKEGDSQTSSQVVNLTVREQRLIDIDCPAYGQIGYLFSGEENNFNSANLVQKLNDKVNLITGPGESIRDVDRAVTVVYSILAESIRLNAVNDRRMGVEIKRSADNTGNGYIKKNLITALNRFIDV